MRRMIKIYQKKINKSDGFTFIELVVLIVILGIIGVAIMPKFTNTVDSMHLRLATEKLKDDLQYIQNFAATNHTSTWFNIDVNSNSYSFGTYDISNNPILLTDLSTNLPATINFNNYNNAIITSENLGGEFEYDWWGTPSKSGQIILNGLRIINIEAETGYVYE